MIRADHKKWAHFVFWAYIKRKFKKRFRAFRLIGEAPRFDDSRPILLAPNHISWWDGFFVYYLNKTFFRREMNLMMLEEQLSKYPFFSKVGAFSIDPGNPTSVVESLYYSANFLEKNKTLLVVYPQGELLPDFARPIEVRGGIDKIIEKSKVEPRIVSLSVKIVYLKEELPEVLFRFEELPSAGSVSAIGKSIERGLDEIEGSILNGNYGKILMSGSRSTSEKSDEFFGAGR